MTKRARKFSKDRLIKEFEEILKTQLKNINTFNLETYDF
jgi:hypothetical protein